MNKKIYQLVIVCLTLCLPSMVLAESVETIIAKHIKAHGGLEKWNKVEALKITGRFTGFSIEKDYMAYKTRSGEYYADLQLGKHKVTEAFDGKTGWTIDPWLELNYARRINSSEENVFAQKAEFTTPFFNYKEKGHQVEFVGKDKCEGLDVFVLKLTRNNGKVEKWYLDAKTFLEYKCESRWVDFTSELPSEVYFDDFRTVEGLVIPFFVERTFWQRDRVLEVKNIDINPDFNKNLIEMPKRKEIKKLAFMKGTWDVKIESVGRDGKWRTTGQTVSNFEFTSTNILQQKIKLEAMFPMNINVSYTFNETSGKYKIALLDDLSSSFEVYEGEFADQNFIFHNLQEKASVSTQFTLNNMSDNEFILTKKDSKDQGKTWTNSQKFTYTRSK